MKIHSYHKGLPVRSKYMRILRKIMKSLFPILFRRRMIFNDIIDLNYVFDKHGKRVYKKRNNSPAATKNSISHFVRSGTDRSLKWSLVDGLLTISGDGKMPDHGDLFCRSPWIDSLKKITAVQIENGVTNIRKFAFSCYHNLTSVSLPDSLEEIDDEAFFCCSSLTAVHIPKNVTSIGNYVFFRCSSLTAVTIPNSVTRIGYGVFAECSSLTAVTIPNSVINIGEWAFLSCSNLTDVTVGEKPPFSIEGKTFDDVPLASCTLHVPAGTKALYLTDGCWKEFGTIVEY
jgi:hypothetical protein